VCLSADNGLPLSDWNATGDGPPADSATAPDLALKADVQGAPDGWTLPDWTPTFDGSSGLTLSGVLSVNPSVVCGSAPKDDCIGFVEVGVMPCTEHSQCNDIGGWTQTSVNLSAAKTVSYTTSPIIGLNKAYVWAVLREEGLAEGPPKPGDIITYGAFEITLVGGTTWPKTDIVLDGRDTGN
jgi:hypothetical protein